MSRALEAALLIEKARRDGARERLREVVASLVREDPGRGVRARILSRLLRTFLGAPPAKRDLGQVLAELGGYAYRDGNERVWKGIALRPDVGAAKRRVEAAWEKRLRADGLPQEPEPIPESWKWGRAKATDAQQRGSLCTHSAGLAERIMNVRTRRIIHGAVFETAAAYRWETTWTNAFEEKTWHLFAIDGMSVREIAAELNESKSWIGKVLTKHKARCGLL